MSGSDVLGEIDIDSDQPAAFGQTIGGSSRTVARHLAVRLGDDR